MKRVVVISGKGGTGKTTISSTLIDLLGIKAIADCDVDAPNLHLIVNNKDLKSNQIVNEPFKSMFSYVIDEDKCINCNKCLSLCKFNAISKNNNSIKINPLLCEGCGVCEYFCPSNAILKVDNYVGKMEVYKSNKIFSSAQLYMGSGNSGKLVSKVKENLDNNITNQNIEIIDGSPGIGCPVIASLAGVDLALIVTEPSLSGLSDMKRIIETAKIFNTKVALVINKANLNTVITKNIEDFSKKNNINLIGKIDYDETVSHLINKNSSLANHETKIYKQLERLSNSLLEIINE